METETDNRAVDRCHNIQRSNLIVDDKLGCYIRKAVDLVQSMTMGDMNQEKCLLSLGTLKKDHLQFLNENSISISPMCNQVHKLCEKLEQTMLFMRERETTRHVRSETTVKVEQIDEDDIGSTFNVSELELDGGIVKEEETDKSEVKQVQTREVEEMEVNDIGSTFNVSEFDWNGAKVKEEEDEGYEGIQVKEEKEIDRADNESTFNVSEFESCGVTVKKGDDCEVKQVTADEKGKKEENSENPQKRVFECKTCKKKCASRSLLQVHEIRHLGTIEERRPYPCDQCDKRFVRWCEMFKHKDTHNPHKKAFKCEMCEQYLSSAAVLASHMMRIHKIKDGKPCTKEFECEICHEFFWDSTTLKKHQRSHRTNDDPLMKLFECSTCQKQYRDKSALKIHERSHQVDIEKQKPIKCDRCEYRCATSKYLKAHMRKHANSEPGECEICKRVFPSKASLSAHVKIHNRNMEKKAHKKSTNVEKTNENDKEECSDEESDEDSNEEDASENTSN